MKCPNCNKTYNDDFKFCPYCGEGKPEPKICPNCELEHNAEFIFCPECGTQLTEKTKYLSAKSYFRVGYECSFDESEKAILNYLKAMKHEPKKWTAEIAEDLRSMMYDNTDLSYVKKLNYIDKFIELKPNCYYFWHIKGIIYKHDCEKAIECYLKTIDLCLKEIELFPEKSYLKKLIEHCFKEIESCTHIYEEIKKYDKEIEQNPYPFNKELIYDKIEFLTEHHQIEEMLKCDDKLIELEPDDEYHWKEKGCNLSKLGRYEEALECYDKAIELSPDDTNYYDFKGYCLELLDRDEEAEECYEKAKSLRD